MHLNRHMQSGLWLMLDQNASLHYFESTHSVYASQGEYEQEIVQETV